MTTENQATTEGGALPSESQWRPSALMTRYDEPSTPVQNAAVAETHEGQTLPVSGTETEPVVGSEPTPAAINPNSPEARHFQSVADRAIAKARAESDAAMADVRTRLAAAEARLQSASAPRQEPQQTQNASEFALDWANAPKFTAPDGSYYDEASAQAIDNAQNAKIQWVLSQLEQRQVQQAAMAQTAQAEQALIGFAQGLEQSKQAELVNLVRQYEPIARQSPDAFIAFAKVQLGLGGTQQQAAPSPQTLAQQEQIIPSSRPTRNATTAPRHAPGMSLEDKIRANVRRAQNG